MGWVLWCMSSVRAFLLMANASNCWGFSPVMWLRLSRVSVMVPVRSCPRRILVLVGSAMR